MTQKTVDLRVGIDRPQYLENFVDRAVLQMLADSKEAGDGEPLRVLETPPFKGGQLEKSIDRLVLDESSIIPLIWGTKPAASGGR